MPQSLEDIDLGRTAWRFGLAGVVFRICVDRCGQRAHSWSGGGFIRATAVLASISQQEHSPRNVRHHIDRFWRGVLVAFDSLKK